MEWFGRSSIDFTHSPAPRMVKRNNGQTKSLLSICESVTPSCQLNPLLFNGHLQTMWTAVKLAGPAVYYKRKIFESDHDVYVGSFAVDFVVDLYEGRDATLGLRTSYYTDEEFDNLGSDDSKPMAVVLHGLSGGSHETYLRECIAPLIGDGGWEVCVVNSRGCSHSKLTSGFLYNARSTWDMRQTVKWLKQRFPNRPLFGIGFSLGANILTNYCGEEGADCLLKGAVACSNPFNLEVCSKLMQNTFIGKELYLRVLGTGMKQLLATHRDDLIKHTNIDMARAMNITYLNEFDRVVQCTTWGYPTEYAYYRDASSVDALLSIKIPFLAVQALDDPIAVKGALPFEEFRRNENVVMLTTSLGGHLCWFEMGGNRWFAKPVCGFLNDLAFNCDLDDLQPKKDVETPTEPVWGSTYAPMRRKWEMGTSGN